MALWAKKLGVEKWKKKPFKDNLGDEQPGRGNGNQKGFEAAQDLDYLRKKKQASMAGEDREKESGVRCSWRGARDGQAKPRGKLFRVLDFIPEATRKPGENARHGFAFWED